MTPEQKQDQDQDQDGNQDLQTRLSVSSPASGRGVDLISIQPRDRWGIIDLNPTALPLIGIGEWQPPPTLADGRAQPQAHEVAARHARVRRVVGVGGAGVQDVRVGDKLDVADLEDHVQLDLVADALEGLECVDLCRRQGRDDAGVAEARQGAHVVRVPFAVDALFFGFGRRCLEVEDGRADVGLLAARHLALAVEIPHRLGQQVGHVRVSGLQGVPHVVDGGDVGLAAFLGACEAEEPHDVRVVGVEELPRVGAVDAHLVDLRAVLAQVLDVAQDVPASVLAHRVSDVRAQAEVCDGALVRAPLLDGEALVQDEALAVEELVAHRLQRRRHRRQGEVVRVDPRQREAGRLEGVRGLREFIDLRLGEDVRPQLRVCRVVLRFPYRRARDRLGECAVRIELVVQWGMLP